MIFMALVKHKAGGGVTRSGVNFAMQIHHLPNFPNSTTSEHLQDIEERLFLAFKLVVLVCVQ
jgi:hypothetical protein